MGWPLEEVAKVAGITIDPATARGRMVARIRSDSRQVQPHDLFVALKGPRSDGHAFISSAVDRGAIAILGDRAHAPPGGIEVPYLASTDLNKAYKNLATAWRAQFSGPVVMVAGSVGKTTTKELTAQVLETLFAAPALQPSSVHKTIGSQNGEQGVPATLLDLSSHHKAAVIEVGIDAVGAMRLLESMVQPTHCVVTAIAEEHLEGLHDLETITREECHGLLETTARGGTIFVPTYDSRIMRFVEKHDLWQSAIAMAFGQAEDSVATLQSKARAFIQARFCRRTRQLALQASDGSSASAVLRSCSLPFAKAALVAGSIGWELGASIEQVAWALESSSPQWGRGQLKTLAEQGPWLICDHYNASPESMRAAFMLAHSERERISTNDRLIVCLGDMRELGEQSADLHASLAKPLMALGPEEVWLVGEDIEALEKALRRQCYAGRLRCFSNAEEAANAAERDVLRKDLLLLKGSRGVGLELVDEVLTRRWAKTKE